MKNTSISPSDLSQCADEIHAYTIEFENLNNRILQLLSYIESKNKNDNTELHTASISLQKEINSLRRVAHSCYQYEEQLHRTAHYYKQLECNIECTLFLNLIDWWDQAYPIIEQIASFTGALTGVAAISSTPFVLSKWIRNKIQEKTNGDEYMWIKIILAENEWNVSILCEKMSLTSDETKKILKGFGYVWDSKKMLYVATENTRKLRDIKSRTLKPPTY